MERQNEAAEPLLEPAEGPRPEQEDAYERGEHQLAEEPLQEPAEGAPEDTDNGGG